MKKAIIVLLVAVVAMTAVFANTSGKDGFAIKVEGIGMAGLHGASYRMGDFEFGLGYLTYTPASATASLIACLCDPEWQFDPMIFLELVYPFGVLASVNYKFIATERHELSAGVKFGYCTLFSSVVATVGVEYDFCFNQNHAIYARVDMPVYPPIPEYAMYVTDIGYRYTF